MAKPQMPAAAPMADDAANDDTAAPDDSTAPADDSASGDTCLVTICKSADGGYMVYAGDEPESGEVDADPAEGGMSDQPKGHPAESIGAALKAALDILKADEENSGEGSAQQNFDAGFTGGSVASPAKAAVPAQKF